MSRQTATKKGQPVNEVLPTAKRVRGKEQAILYWIYKTIGELQGQHEYETFLRDGSVLCRLMKHLVWNSVPDEEISSGGERQKVTNVKMLIDALRFYGVAEEYIFSVEDLLYMRNIPKVTKCLYELGKLVAQDEDYFDKVPVLQGALEDEEEGKGKGIPREDELSLAHVSIDRVSKQLSEDKPKPFPEKHLRKSFFE